MLWASLIVRSYILVNRCQTELQKTIGQPAQSPEVFIISKDVASLSSRLETLDKKVDSINLVRIVLDMRSSTDIATWYVASTTTRKLRSFKASKINKPRFSQRSYLFSPCCNQSLSTLKTLATMSRSRSWNCASTSKPATSPVSLSGLVAPVSKRLPTFPMSSQQALPGKSVVWMRCKTL